LDGGKFLYQLLKVVVGFIAAVLACGVFLSWGFFRAGAPDTDPIGFAATIGTGLVSASIVGATALVPATVLIGLAEAARLRSVIFHVGAAGALAFAVWTLGEEVAVDGVRPGSAVAVAAGFIAGAVYWLIAGRTSGVWHAPARHEDGGRSGDATD